MHRRPANIEFPQELTASGYTTIDTGGYFIRGINPATVECIDNDKYIIFPTPNDLAEEYSVVASVTQKINGGDKGLAERKFFTRKAKEVLL